MALLTYPIFKEFDIIAFMDINVKVIKSTVADYRLIETNKIEDVVSLDRHVGRRGESGVINK